MQPEGYLRFLAAAALAAMLGACATTGGTAGRAAGADAPVRPEERMTSRGLANLRLAHSYLNAGKLELAMDRAGRALRSDPDSADVHVVLGLIQARLGKQAAAGEYYARAARLAPGEGYVENVYGVWLCERGDSAAADQAFARGAGDPFFEGRTQIHYNAARCALRAGNPARAEAHLREGLKAAPEDAPLLALMAEVQYAQRNYLSARAFIQRREAAGAATPELLDLGARIEQGAGDAVAAERYRRRLREQFPDYSPTATEESRLP